MRRLLIGLIFLMVACSRSPAEPVAQTTASPSPSANPVATPSATTSDLPHTKVNFSCRLPVVRSSYLGTSPFIYSGGFITFPAGTFAVDPTGGVSISPQGGMVVTDASPKLYNGPLQFGGPSYDRAEKRWLPAAASQVSPDGAFYAYGSFDPQHGDPGRIHIVNVSTATEKVFAASPPTDDPGFSVAEFNSAGIYLVANQVQRAPAGAWLMNPVTGEIRPLTHVDSVLAIREGNAWIRRVDPRDPSPPVTGKGTPSDSVVQVDLATGAQTIWFYRPGSQVELQGFDSGGRPVVVVFDPSASTILFESRLIDGPGSPGSVLYAGQQTLGGVLGDGNRLWLSGSTGIYLYTADRGLQKVFESDPAKEGIIPVASCL
jgi:hypothetical protein